MSDGRLCTFCEMVEYPPANTKKISKADSHNHEDIEIRPWHDLEVGNMASPLQWNIQTPVPSLALVRAHGALFFPCFCLDFHVSNMFYQICEAHCLVASHRCSWRLNFLHWRCCGSCCVHRGAAEHPEIPGIRCALSFWFILSWFSAGFQAFKAPQMNSARLRSSNGVSRTLSDSVGTSRQQRLHRLHRPTSLECRRNWNSTEDVPLHC